MADRERRRAQILSRARDVFARKGYHQAKIDDIVAAAGVARGTFYLYFHDKKAIFEELVNRFFQTIAMGVARIDTHGDVDAQIQGNLARVLQVCQDDPAMTKILLADAVGLDAEFDRRLLAFYADIEALLERALGEGQDLGIVQPGDRRVLAHFLIGGLKEVVLQLVRAPVPVDREAVVRDLFAVLQHGVLGTQRRSVRTKATKKRG
jgi:AcrR family transcriptional regulator